MSYIHIWEETWDDYLPLPDNPTLSVIKNLFVEIYNRSVNWSINKIKSLYNHPFYKNHEA